MLVFALEIFQHSKQSGQIEVGVAYSPESCASKTAVLLFEHPSFQKGKVCEAEANNQRRQQVFARFSRLCRSSFTLISLLECVMMLNW